MSSTTYNYGIIGAGAAGLHLALAMIEDPWFRDKSVLILDKDPKEVNDKTWCFWEKGGGKWDTIITKSWEKGKFTTSSKDLELDLQPYLYKMLRSIDFYTHARNKILAQSNFTWIREEVLELLDQDPVGIGIVNQTLNAKHVFDSRIDSGYSLNNKKYIHVLQHFKGWYITTEKAAFNPSEFVMMDYRPKWKSTTSFMYLLPVTSNKALLEFTFFSPELVEDPVYDQTLEKYIAETLGIKNYRIEEVEKGIIPMTNYPFHHANSKNITKIGTAGSWVKGSTGYSFKNAERKVQLIIENLKKGQKVDSGLILEKFRYYDHLFLDLLNRKNERGEALFTTMYSKNSIQAIFEFLDEQTTISKDLKIMASFNPLPFMQAILRSFFKV